MDLTIFKLRKKFNQELEKYIGREIGAGTQDFVFDVLLSPEIFNLKKGRLATPLLERRNEVIKEDPKKGKSIDYVIYIDSDIIIPVEVERLQNIEKGREQILDYQKVLEKKYGILTDGYIWRFYNNTIYREYNWDDISKNTKEFLTFWKEYIKPENYYLRYFEDIGQSKLFKDEGSINVEENRSRFFNDITLLIESFKNKLKVEHYFDNLEKKDKEKKAIEITYAYIIQFILYKTLVDNEFDDFKKEYKETVEDIYEYIKSQRFKDILGAIKKISSKISANIYKPFAKEQEFIGKRLDELFISKNDLADVSPWLDIFVFIKKYNFRNLQNEIFGYIYENYLKELFEETKKGQYFTDPAVVNFMLEQIGYSSNDIKEKIRKGELDKLSIIDPSCGSGTFLYRAVDQIIDSFAGDTEAVSKKIEDLVINNVFGLDIAEFPLYLAEMNILMRMLPLIINQKYNNPIDKKIKVFWTEDSIAEFINVKFNNPIQGKRHNATGMIQMSLDNKFIEPSLTSYVRSPEDIREMKLSMQEMPRRRFDFVIGNPPYVGYNECSKQKVKIFEKMKQGEVKLNDIYGVNLHSTPLDRKKYSPKPNLYAFFISLGLALLKDNGKICYIIPQTILTSGELDVLRYYLAKFTAIEKIITFSGKMFIGRGLKQNKPVPTSSLIFVLSLKEPANDHEVKIVHYTDPNDDIEQCLKNISNNKKVSKKDILQTKLLEDLINWNFITKDNRFLDFYDSYKHSTESISIYYDHISAENIFKNKFYFDGSFNIPTKDILESKTGALSYWEIPSIKSAGYLSRIIGYFPKNKKIKIAEGSQGMIMLNTKYKAIWRYVNPDKFLFIEGNDVFPRFQQFCIASNSKEEIFYLLSILNSRISSLLINNLLKSENEKDLLLGVSAIKEFIRVPKITKENQFIKDEIITRTEEMLGLEDVLLSDLIDFSKVLVQKFDNIEVQGTDLILIKEGEKIKCKIKKDARLVKKTIEDKYVRDKLFKDEIITLPELKSLPVIDFEKQKEIKEYIDDLVFALYFKVPVKKVGLNKAKEIKELCEKNKFYEVVEGKV